MLIAGVKVMSNDKATIQTRITPKLKQEAESVLAAMGLKLSDGIRLFLNQVVTEHGLPFKPQLRESSAGFKKAIRELDEGRGTKFDSAADFRAHWENEE